MVLPLKNLPDLPFLVRKLEIGIDILDANFAFKMS